MTRYRPGEPVGGWVLATYLGSGGNSEVWAVENDSGDLALKILRSLDAGSEPYRRFQREVEVQSSLTAEQFDGVLPVIAYAVPDRPSRQHPAWLAMRRAETMERALGESPSLTDVVSALARVADTLARLSDRDIHHRDIKPANLYLYDGDWSVGDFGLIKVPEAEPLTVGAKGLGPRHFIAPEMLVAPDGADGGPADVYSLAKTLWVSGTGQRVPLPGEHRIDVPALRLSSYVEHPRARLLDRLIEKATRTVPTDRPTMREFAAELQAWLREPLDVAQAGDLSVLRDEVEALLEPARRAQQGLAERRRLGEEALSVLEEGLHHVADLLRDVGLHPIIDFYEDRVALKSRVAASWVLRGEEWSDLNYLKVGRRVEYESRFLDGSPRSVYLWAAVRVRTVSDGRAVLGAALAVGGHPNSAGLAWDASDLVALGSALERELLDTLRNGLVANLPRAVEGLMQMLR